MQKYDIMGVIGEGAYGVVLKCRCNTNSEVVAIKKFKQSEEDQIVRKTTMREVKVLKMVRHTNIVELKQAFRKKGIVYLVFQYVQNNLLQVLQKSQQGLQPQIIRSLMYQLFKGLAYLHSLGLIHRDIKPENLLISQKKQLKICDFGFARLAKKGQQDLTDYVATRWYRPPQLLVEASYGPEIDIWAAGCIFGELIDGNPMFPGQNQIDQLFLIQKCLGPLISDHSETFLKNPRFLGMKFPDIHNLQTIDKRYLGKLVPKALHFLKQLLRMNPSDRLTAEDALKHPYFDGLREETLERKLSSNNYVKYESRLSHFGSPNREVEPMTAHQDQRKQHIAYNPPANERERTEQTSTAGQFNRSTKMQMGKKPRQNITKLLNSRAINSQIQSKSVNKNGKPTQKQLKQKHISLEKHQHREVLTKTQTGFYILTGDGIKVDKDSQSGSHSRNKVYNTKSPRNKNNPNFKQLPTHTQGIAEEDQMWQSTGQLPLIVLGSQQSRGEKQATKQTNIIITNSTFNYKSHNH